MNVEQARKKLADCQQAQLLRYYDELPADRQAQLLEQIDDTDFSVTEQVRDRPSQKDRGTISPIRAMQLPEIQENREHFTQIGLETIRAGKVGAVLLAGGMGTRLGSENPKGMYDIGITKPVYIFGRIIRNLLDVVDASGTWIHLFIMTSEKNHEITKRFF